MKTRKNRKAFTLIELLVVIAIIAVLSVVVILSLNPAELLRQARDSNRVSDLANLKSALSLYLADVSSPVLYSVINLCSASLTSGNGATVWVTPLAGGAAVSTSTCLAWMPKAAGAYISASTTASGGRAVDSTGWIPVNFNNISSGAPIGSLPVDPVNVSGTSASAPGYFYSYEASGTTFKFGANIESTKYKNGGGSDVVSTDGGVNNYIYEQGTALSL
ncbi:MAG TPA: type II secretion system protein [Candidatus Paceibacterota bacterium]|nr:type II secretion system protein [Candidatus Paceibacterota bacterium]